MENTNYRKINSLVAKAIKGDERAFTKLCKMQAQRIIYSCIRQMGNVQDGEDAAQEVFVKMQTKIGTLQQPGAFFVWTQRIIYSVCNNMRQASMKQSNKASIEDFADLFDEKDEAVLPEEHLSNEEKRRELMTIIDLLPDRVRSCVVMHYFDQLKISEIADVLEITEGAVKSQLYLGRKKLKDALIAKDEEAYTRASKANALLPLAALGTAFEQDMLEMVPAHMVNHCMLSAGLKVTAAGASAASFLALPVVQTTATAVACVACAAALVSGSFVASTLLSEEDLVSGGDSQRSQNEDLQDRSEALPEEIIPEEKNEVLPENEETPIPDAYTVPETPQANTEEQAPIVVPQATHASLSGKAQIEGTSGSDERYALYYASLEKNGEQVVAQTLDSYGNYHFQNIYVPEASDYHVSIKTMHNYDSEVTISPSFMTIQLSPGNTFNVAETFTIRGMEDGSMTAMLLDSGSNPTLTNPAIAYFQTSNVGQATIAWQIETGSGEIVASGQSNTLDSTTFNSLSDGTYFLKAQAQGSWGSTAETTKEFYIYGY